MARLTAWATLILLVPMAAAGEPGPEIAGGNVLHFRMELGTGTTRVIEACLRESTGAGTGYDAAFLDLDGDEEFETARVLRETTHPRTKLRMRDNRIAVRHGGAVWTLEVDALRSPVSAKSLVAGTTSVHWSVQTDDLYVRFLSSPLELHRSRERARAAKPFRMGPPLALKIGATTRGSRPMVTLDLLGPNGGSLAAVRRGGKEVRPDVRVLAAEEEKVAARPGYS